jgi:gluconolactonase
MTTGMNPVLDFGIDKSTLQYVGHDLQRPECILAEPDGTLWSADARGGVMRIAPNGSQQLVTQRSSQYFEGAHSEAARYLEGTLPNGLAFTRDGDILISNFGTDCLEVMTRDGESRVLADSIDGEPIGKVNFVLRDSKDRIWITISTRIKNWMHALRSDLADGYLARLIDGKFRIVADGFRFTNEIRFDAREEWMYVVETTGGCITRLRIDGNSNPVEREIFGPSRLGKGAWPDGIAFDSYGNLWGTLVYSDKLFVLTPQGGGRPGAGLFQRPGEP